MTRGRDTLDPFWGILLPADERSSVTIKYRWQPRS
jgi:hypothetical protein